MRTYYTTAASTWGTQSYESYTGSSSSSTQTATYSAYAGPDYSETYQRGTSSYSTSSITSNSSANHSLTELNKSMTWSTRFSETGSSTFTLYYSDATQTESYSRSSTYSYSRNYSYVSVEKTLRNLTGLSEATTFNDYFSSFYSDYWTVFHLSTFSTDTFDLGTSTQTTINSTDASATVIPTSFNVATTSSFAVGSYQITVTASTTSETITTTSLSSTRTYGSTSTGTNAVYTSTSAIGYTNNTVGISSFSTYTSSAASSTITVTFNPRVERMVAYERGTAERMFALTSAFENTTKLLSEAVSECNTYTDVALTVLTNTTSQFFNGLTSSSTTASSSFVSVYPAFTQLRGTYLALPPYTDAYFGGYNQGTTSVSFGEGVFDRTYSDAVFGFETTQRFTNSSSFSAIYTASVMRINPLIYLSFDSTTTDYQNLVLTYNTTSLANP